MADENVKEKTTETSAAQKRTESFGSYKEHTIDAKTAFSFLLRCVISSVLPSECSAR